MLVKVDVFEVQKSLFQEYYSQQNQLIFLSFFVQCWLLMEQTTQITQQKDIKIEKKFEKESCWEWDVY